MKLRTALINLVGGVNRVRAEIAGLRAPPASARRAPRGAPSRVAATVAPESRVSLSVARQANGAEGNTARVQSAGSATASEQTERIGVRTVVVDQVVRETDDAVSLVLKDSRQTPFRFSPGQFLTLIVEIDGERLRRSYSISSSADVVDTVTITVKRVEGGKVSSHLVERAHAGMCMDVLGPAGSFTPSSSGRLVLIAGGSGITPMMSIVRTVLAREPEARIDLLYANRSALDVIFKDALDALVREHAPRLVVLHALGAALNRELAAGALETLHAGNERGGAPAEHFLCGPEPMMREVRAALLERGIPDTLVREEKFSQAKPLRSVSATRVPRRDASAKTVQLRVRSESDAGYLTEIWIATDVTILEAALAAGIELPHSCTEGTCGSCRVRATDPAAIDMSAANCLSSTEIKRGYVLTCVSRALGDVELTVE